MYLVKLYLIKQVATLLAMYLYSNKVNARLSMYYVCEVIVTSHCLCLELLPATCYC